ncbi:MAG: HesA/MoeB/ThiF family protein [Betaproteobacteria bacterium]
MSDNWTGFSEAELERYSRQLLLKEVGGKGQRKLREARVLVVGAGGLGSPVIAYLAAAGVGTLGVVDFDRVELSNLQRQILHRTEDVGRPKAESAARAVKALNPGVEVAVHRARLGQDNVRDLIGGYDLVIDGVDNFASRYLLNDACVMAKKPLIEAGILRFDGMIMTIKPGEGPCYRCVFPDPPPPGAVPSCQEAGVIGAVAGVMGVLQANEALKLILGIGEPLVGRMLVFDALAASFREIALKRQPTCRVCGEEPAITELVEYQLACELQRRGEAHE